MRNLKYFFIAIQIIGIVTDWASKAMQDGKITLKEAIDLAERIAKALGIPTDINLPV